MAMAKAEYMLMSAGAIALSGGFADQKRFPDNGVRIIMATMFLTFLAALASKSPIDPVVKAFSGLILLATVYAYVPAFQRAQQRPKQRKEK